ncbi:MAG: CatB-related O-acetyltransferase [Oliverpabstia sp.]|nr:CatB-related O-acetyltransferase [Oliverpabstia sp.]
MILGYIKRVIKLFIRKRTWRKQNSHNYTSINSIFDHELCKVGNYTYGVINVLSNNNKSKVIIGNFCSIANNVCFLINNDHRTDVLTTYPIKAKLFGEASECVSKGDIIVEDDVWIGSNVTVLSGVNIGQGAVIATGSVVTKNVPPYAFVGGVPAKVIKYRYSEEIINRLLLIDYSKVDKQFIKNNLNLFYKPIDTEFDFLSLPQKEDEHERSRNY